MDIHAIPQLVYMVFTVKKLIIGFIVNVGSTEIAEIQKADLCACLILIGLVPTVHQLIYVLIYHVESMAFVKIILIILLVCVTTVSYVINAKSTIFVFCVITYLYFCIEIHAKIMEHVFHILMVTSATASECERARSVKNKNFAFWITLAICTEIVSPFSQILVVFLYFVGLVHFAIFKSFVTVYLMENIELVKKSLNYVIAFVIHII